MSSPLVKALRKQRASGSTLVRSTWLFPLILLFCLIILTSLRISGTSVGIYYPVLYGQSQKDPNLLFGQPQSIRSDEWLVVTQLTIAQQKAGYPLVNHNLNHGENMSVVEDAPYKDWSAIFRPQNLSFFIMPIAYAFALKWWLLLFLTIVSCYFLVLRFLPKRRLLASVIGIAVGFSPFLFWWYQTITFAPVFYGFFIVILGMRIINNERVSFLKKRRALSSIAYILALSYLLTAFALILYPPFQIPIIIAVVAYLIGYFLQQHPSKRELLSKAALKKLVVFAVSGMVAIGLTFTFIYTRHAAVAAVDDTVYPGSRAVAPGGTSTQYLFSSFLQPQLERIDRAAHYFANQSTASNFILLLPFLFIPACCLLVYEYRQKQRVNWQLLLIQLCALLFLANMYMPALEPLYKITFLDKVPHDRLLIGLGFAGVLQLLLIMRSLSSLRFNKLRLWSSSAAYSSLCLGLLIWAGLYTRSIYPQFIGSTWLIVGLALFFSLIIFCFLSRKFLPGAILFLLFSALCICHIHPIYRGLGPLYNSKLTQAIDKVSTPQDTWVVLDNIYFENIPLLSNRDSLSGVQLYPNLSFWRQVEGPKGDDIYNRYAHVVFNSAPNFTAPLKLVQTDEFQVKFACTSFIEKNVQYALVSHPLTDSCTSLADEVHYPAVTFYLYRVH